MRARPAGFWALALACLCALSPWAPPLWAQADPVPALEKRKGEAGFGALALKAAQAAPDLMETIRILSALAPLALGGDSALLYRELAPLLELEGRWREASLAWEKAARADPSTGALQLSYAASCALYDGDADRSLALATEAARLPGHDAARLSLVSAWAQCLKGDAPSALRTALSVIALGDARYEPSALVLAAALSQGAEREGYLSALESRYPGSPESAGLPPVLLLRLASLSGEPLLKPGAPEAPGVTEARVQPESSPASAEVSSKASYYQVGAYRSKENAEAMIKRLKDKGFAPALAARKDSEGGDIFIVYVSVDGEGEHFLLKLKDAGFEAWPLAAAP